MLKYEIPAELPLRAWSFQASGRQYSGTGSIRWDPENGFTVFGPINRVDPPPKSITLDIGPTIFVRSGVKAVLTSGDYVFFSFFPEQFSLALTRQIEVTCPEAFFFEPGVRNGKYFCGKVVASVGRKHIGDRQVETTRTLGGKIVHREFGWHALSFSENDIEIQVEFDIGKGHFSWKCGHSRDRRFAWKLGSALPMAVGFFMACSNPVLERSLSHVGSRRSQFRRRVRSRYHGLSLFKLQQERLSSEDVARLALFLTQDDPAALVFRTFYRRAANQRDTRDRKFFISSSLEAILKSLDLAPYKGDPSAFRKKSNDFEIEKSIRDFGKLIGLHQGDAELVQQDYRKLRHSEAHPHWLDEESPEPFESVRDRFDAERRLAAFLGHLLHHYSRAGTPINISSS